MGCCWDGSNNTCNVNNLNSTLIDGLGCYTNQPTKKYEDIQTVLACQKLFQKDQASANVKFAYYNPGTRECNMFKSPEQCGILDGSSSQFMIIPGQHVELPAYEISKNGDGTSRTGVNYVLAKYANDDNYYREIYHETESYQEFAIASV